MPRSLLNPVQAEWRIALSYGVFAALWFVFAHKFLLVFFGQNGSEKLDIFVDITFGLISSALFYILVRRSRNAQERGTLRELEHLTEFQRFFGGTIEYAMFNLNAGGLVCTWDAQAARMHGLTTNQVLNKPVKECFATQESWNPEQLFKQAQSTGKAAHTGWLTRKDGYRYWGEVIFEQIKLPDEQVTYLVVTRDLSGSRANERFKSMIESMTEGLIVIDREWRFAFINANGARLLERDGTDLIGKNIWLEYPTSLGSEFGLACRKAMDQDISTIIDDVSSASARWLENRIYPSPDGILIFYSDVTDKRQAQEAIRINEQRLRMVLLAGQQNFFEIDLRSRTVVTDVYHLSGLGNKAIQKAGVQQALEDWYEQIYPDDRTHVLEELNAFVSGNRAEYWVEYRWKIADGSWRWKLSQGAILEHDETSQAVRMLGTQIDIQSFKSIEQALQTSNRRYLKLMEASPVAIFEANSNGETVYVNARWQEITGYDRLLAMNQGWSTTLHPEDRSGVLAAWKEAVEGQKAYAHEYRFQHADGTTRWVYGLAEPLKDQNGNVTGYLGSMVDLTSRKRIELELEAVRKRSIAIVTALPTPIVVLSPEGLVEEWNPAATALFGWSADEVIGRFVPLVSPEDTSKLFDRISGGAGLKGLEIRPLHRDGFQVDTLLYTEALPTTESNPLSSTVAVYVDMTQHKQDSLKLEQSEKMFRLISENSSDMISLVNLQGVKQYVSPAVNQVLGYSVEEFLTLAPSDWTLEYDPQKSLETQGRLLRGESSVELERYRARRKDGAIIWLEVSARMVKDPITESMSEIQTSARDITSRVEVQEALEASEYLYRTITENSYDMTLVVDLDSVIQYVSPAVKTVLGFDPEKILNTQAISYIHPDDLEKYLENRRLAIEKGQDILRFENRTRCNDQSYIWTESIIKIIRDDYAQAKELQITLRDITERVIVQDKLQTSENLYRTITENSYDVTFLTSSDALILYVSPSIKLLSGFEPEEMILTPIMNYFHPDDLEKHMASRRDAFEQGLNMFRSESRLRRKDGHYIWVESILKIKRDEHGKVKELQVTSRDITERIIIQGKLEASERLYRTITENAQDVIVVSTADSKVRYLSPSAKSVFGYDESEFDKLSNFDLMYPEDRDDYLKARQEAIENRKEFFKSSFRMRHRNGNYIWIESTAKLIRDSDTGALVEIQSTLRDISERVIALKKLEASERLYRTITENAQDVIVVSTADRQLRYVSPSASTVFGYDQNNIANMLSVESMHPDDQIAYLALRQDALDQHKDRLSTIFRVKHQNGNYIWIETLSKFVYDPETKALREIQATLRDVTSRKNAQEALEQLNAELEQRVEERTKRLNEVNQELESFTSSVSHDLRSPLNVIQGFGRAFLEDYSDTTPIAGQDFVNRIVGAAGRMDVLITDLLQYSRLSKAEIRLIPINLEQMLLELVHEFEIERERLNASISLKGNFPMVLARETILRQILINLIGNSLKFSRTGTSPEITIWAELEPHSQMVNIHVQDNGIGIQTIDLERIFQPFERLHGVSEYPGSGIGLAFVKRGIERMGGQIGVTSTLGKGSHFWLLLNKPREMT